MRILLLIIKNKFILATSLFLVFSLFLDDNDIFSLISQKNKLSELEEKKSDITIKLNETRGTLGKLKYTGEIERFARENKFFKKDDEDVFVIFYE